MYFINIKKKWKFKIHFNKRKILIFNGTTKDYKHTFMIGNTILENVKEYKYLGITFTKLNNFRITKLNSANKLLKPCILYYQRPKIIIYQPNVN